MVNKHPLYQSVPGLKPGDYNIIVNDFEHTFLSQATVFRSDGTPAGKFPCLAKGQHADWAKFRGDTPPGIYKLGQLTITQPYEPTATWAAYGKYFFALVDVKAGQSNVGRAGIGLHAGGSSLSNPLAPMQPLVPSWGCIRAHALHLETLLLPVYRKCQSTNNTIYVCVNQF